MGASTITVVDATVIAISYRGRRDVRKTTRDNIEVQSRTEYSMRLLKKLGSEMLIPSAGITIEFRLLIIYTNARV